jgi:hypothetical protein
MLEFLVDGIATIESEDTPVVSFEVKSKVAIYISLMPRYI